MVGALKKVGDVVASVSRRQCEAVAEQRRSAWRGRLSGNTKSQATPQIECARRTDIIDDDHGQGGGKQAEGHRRVKVLRGWYGRSDVRAIDDRHLVTLNAADEHAQRALGRVRFKREKLTANERDGRRREALGRLDMIQIWPQRVLWLVQADNVRRARLA